MARVSVGNEAIEIALTEEGEGAIGRASLRVAWRKRPSRQCREIIVAPDAKIADRRPIQSKTRATLLRGIANGRAWLDELVAGRAADIEAIAKREHRSKRSIAMMISLAFLSPHIVEAAVDGRPPRGVGVRRLVDLPSDGWSRAGFSGWRRRAETAHYTRRDSRNDPFQAPWRRQRIRRRSFAFSLHNGRRRLINGPRDVVVARERLLQQTAD